MAEAARPRHRAAPGGKGLGFTHVRAARSGSVSYVADQSLSRGNQGAFSWSRVAPGEAATWTLVKSSQEQGVPTRAASQRRTLPGASRLEARPLPALLQ